MAKGEDIAIRPLTNESEFRDAVELQKLIWGFDEIELLPVRLFVVATKIGGQAYGAFDGDRMVAFCLAIPGMKPGPKPYLHSHMLGVMDGYRDHGIGRRIKMLQKEDALARGIDLIEWTFDPLEIKNAWFNIERLGAVVRRYVRNQYGTTTSHLHGGLPTDRCVAEWWIASERPSNPEILARVEVPDKADATREVQARIASEFENAFARGLQVVGVERRTNGGAYLFGAIA